MNNASPGNDAVSPPVPRVIMLVNPAAGKGRAIAVGDAAAAAMRELGAEVSVVSGGSVDETRALAAAAVAKRPDVLAVVGGDGTLASILEQVIGSDVPIALVPAGTGNDLARALGLDCGTPAAIAKAVEIALRGEAHAIDLGEATCPDGRRKFLTVTATGFDAQVSDLTNRLRWPKGPLRYYLALIIELVRLRPLPFTVRVDGELSAGPGILVAVGNTRCYGGGMPICPEADPSDGLFEVVHVGAIGRFTLLRLFPLLLRAAHLDRPEVHYTRGRVVEIEAPGLIAYADGERIGTESVRLEVLPGALRLMMGAPQRIAEVTASEGVRA